MELKLDQLTIDTIRMLAADQVERANSGHPGMPLGAAPMAHVLWRYFLRHNPKNPKWFNRDRFILSAGHGSALLYSLLFLNGYPLTLDDLKQFRQWGSLTPGHPEFGLTKGVEATTGPLGQGFSMGVGMAIAQRFMAARYNKPSLDIVDHRIFAIVSDGDLMEGISSEAASLAGNLKLGNLIYLYDDNSISIEGSTDLAFTEDVVGRFESYGWDVQRVEDGNDLDKIYATISKAISVIDQPSLIAVKTKIGFGSPKENLAKAHGEPLGKDAIAATRSKFGFPRDKSFYVSDEVNEYCTEHIKKLSKYEDEWNQKFKEYQKKFPDESKRLKDEIEGKTLSDLDLSNFDSSNAVATRVASGKIINHIAKACGNLIGGSADLAPSNKSYMDGCGDFSAANYSGRNIHFGVREHAMAAVTNGMALHGGVIPYCATFLVFSDYMRPAIRLSALMKTQSIFVFTHDSIGVGEDGPTHQPIEHIMSLRMIPNLTVLRPADANETIAAWKVALSKIAPVAIILTRQDLPVLKSTDYPVLEGVRKGAYILAEGSKKPQLIIIATGSEVSLAIEARGVLEEKGISTRVVSMPSWELFDAQHEDYKETVLPSDIKARISVEAGVTLGWQKWVGDDGVSIGIDRFGASAPYNILMENFGFTVENIVDRGISL